jgi:hypothetical protein
MSDNDNTGAGFGADPEDQGSEGLPTPAAPPIVAMGAKGVDAPSVYVHAMLE